MIDLLNLIYERNDIWIYIYDHNEYSRYLTFRSI